MVELLRFENIIHPLRTLTWIGLLILGVIIAYYVINIGNRYLERSKRIVVDTELLKKIILGVVAVLFILLLMRRYSILGRVLAAGIIATILAYILNPLVDKLEAKGNNRIASVAMVYVTIFVVIGILLVVVVPKTTMEIRNLALELPAYAENISNTVSGLFEDLPLVGENPAYETISNSVQSSYESIIDDLMNWVRNSASRITVLITHFVQNFISVILSLVLVLIMTFYFLVDKRLYTNKIQGFIPNSFRTDISYLSEKINTVLSEFIRGRIILAVFVGILTAILLLILRIDFAIVIGIITCIADIIPYIGPLLGFVPAFLFALIESPVKALIVAIFYVFIQWAENNILAPKIIGDSMGLNPLFIFLSIIIGGGIFGVWGMVVSVPLAAIALILIDFFKAKYKQNQLKEEKDGNYKIWKKWVYTKLEENF